MDALPNAGLHLYIVWVAVKNVQTPQELEANAAREGTRFAGRRTSSYVDVKGEATRAFAIPLKLEPRLGVQLPAWDAYLAYGPQRQWESDSVPAPDYWMHQLSNAPKQLTLNGDEFRAHVVALLSLPPAAAAAP